MTFNSPTLLLLIIAIIFFVVLKTPSSKLFEKVDGFSIIAIIAIIIVVAMVYFSFSISEKAFTKGNSLLELEIFNELGE